jgi:hypothetical protein
LSIQANLNRLLRPYTGRYQTLLAGIDWISDLQSR